MATARRFVFRKGMPIFMREYGAESIAKQMPSNAEDPFEQPTWLDSNIKVWALPARPHSANNFRVARPQSPRKRSLGEFQETDNQIDQHAEHQLMRQAVVSDMFNSTWKMDALVETPIAEVKMPATLFVRNPETKDLEPYKGPIPGDNQPLPDIKVLVRKPWPGATVGTLPPTSPSYEAISYIVRNHDIRGKFDVAKAQELKVPKGPAYSELTRGESVQSTDGRTITPQMVMGPGRPGKGIAILDVPSPDYVEDLLNRPEWNSPTVTTELKAFVWILGPGVGDHPKLQEFVARMSHCKHTVSSSDYCPNYLALTSAAQAAVRLARLRGENYPVPVHDNVTVPQAGTPTAGTSLQKTSFEPLDPGLIVDMEPQFQIKRDEVMTRLNTAETIFQIPRSVDQRMRTIRTRVTKKAFRDRLADIRKDLPGAEVEIISLGTGSSIPSKYRNVSATLLNVPGYGYYLLDCGENTLGQMKRVFGPEKMREVLQNLRMIWISHLHADHHLGTAAVIKAWYQENYGTDTKQASQESRTRIEDALQEKRLAIASDEMMIAWLEEYSAVEDFGFDKLLPLCAHPDTTGPKITTKFSFRHNRNGSAPFGVNSLGRTILDFKDESSPLTPLLKSSTGLADILTTRVAHCKGALAVSLVFPDGFKVSYSGDCRPSDKFASIGQGSTVLIHEATFQDDMVGSALAKRHSTAAEAIEVGRRMGARAVLLTHFSQRYQKVAHVEQCAAANKRDDTSSTQQTESAAERQSGDADIPFDDPEEPPAAPTSAAALLDDIRFPSPGRPGLPHYDATSNVTVPVAAAMDYMRIKVGDIAIAQAFAPALEKMIDILEKDTTQQAEAAKKVLREAEEARKAQKTKKFGGKKTAAAAVATLAVTEEPKQPELPAHSVWSASESESGWETSDNEERGS
ncbi:hypothetical protein N7462_006091 [Penicillium macrosclerotiorum]|uniref:uncharacterized protein n=1 Tax=Penicillium macrosclerotiorum TaxID=303699 RepID=UPI002549AD82|nr:uncharacterized protein N7462_006091 [Penicillium macrosclerotiorum]KAJ5682926.1 hypothetical protein N7462_006091 [Penicillium macrosclerotiorum]